MVDLLQVNGYPLLNKKFMSTKMVVLNAEMRFTVMEMEKVLLRATTSMKSAILRYVMRICLILIVVTLQ